MKYTARFFKETLLEWKRKKDSFLVRHLYRPISFYSSAWFSNHNVNANFVGAVSILVKRGGLKWK